MKTNIKFYKKRLIDSSITVNKRSDIKLSYKFTIKNNLFSDIWVQGTVAKMNPPYSFFIIVGL